MRWTPEGKITFFNKFAQKFFGFEETEIIGKDVMGTIVPHFELSGRDLSARFDCADERIACRKQGIFYTLSGKDPVAGALHNEGPSSDCA